MRKLSEYKRNHPLLEALTEYNRLVKANYLLCYIDDASLRNYVQRALNRGEAYHQLRRAVSSVNGDQFRGSSDEEIQLWNECARLVTNAIVYFNSRILSQLLTSFEYQGDTKRIDIVKQASPVAWHNINLKGTYHFELSEKLPDLEELMRSIEGYLPVSESNTLWRPRTARPPEHFVVFGRKIPRTPFCHSDVPRDRITSVSGF